ncbi:MAG: IS200/IS605 family transposase [Oligoflexia bacterium]|nr:IS200/IS605 family transposase [Oligoflexia bacterium]
MSYDNLSHTRWEHIYHVVFIPYCRKKVLYGKVRTFLGPKMKELASQRGSEILEGHMVQDHVHMMIKIPPKYSVSEVIGYIKGKSAIAIARQFSGKKRNFNGEKFWARGYANLQTLKSHHLPDHSSGQCLDRIHRHTSSNRKKDGKILNEE